MKKRYLVGICLAVIASAHAEPLPALPHVNTSKITVSGLSAGGAMAQQIAVAFSDHVSGVAAIAGPPYLCAQLGIFYAGYKCSQFGDRFLDRFGGLATQLTGDPKDPDVKGWTHDARRFAAEGWIAPLDNIRSQRVWLLRGTEDNVGPGPNTFRGSREFFKQFGATVAPIEPRPRMHHTMPTAKAGLGKCEIFEKSPEADFLSSCEYPAAEELLAFLHPGLPASGQSSGELVPFDQKPYTVRVGDWAPEMTAVEPWQIGMAATGWAFVPNACRSGVSTECRVHVALHGCSQGDDDVTRRGGHRFVKEAGYNDWAAMHNVIVLYPQTDIETRQGQFWENKYGCWDWWGETSPERPGKYATQRGAQVRSIMNMVEALSKARDAR